MQLICVFLIVNKFILHVSFLAFIEDLYVFVIFAKVTNVIYAIMRISRNAPVFLSKRWVEVLGTMLKTLENKLMMTNVSVNHETVVEAVGSMTS